MKVKSMERRVFTDGNRSFSHDFLRKSIKNINIRIHPDGRVAVSAPEKLPEERVQEFLAEKQDSIFRVLNRLNELSPRLNYTGSLQPGGQIYCFGYPKTLEVIQGTRNAVYTTGQSVILSLRDERDEKMRASVLERWKREQMQTAAKAMCDLVYPRVRDFGVEYPQLRIRKMKARWGSCHVQKKIVYLNTELFSYPSDCLEYVILHELVHFLEPNHSAKFYEWMNRLMPDWRERRKILNPR